MSDHKESMGRGDQESIEKPFECFKNEHRTSNVQHRMMNQKELFTSIKTAVQQAHGPERSRRADKKYSIKVRCSRFLFDVRRSMFDSPEAEKCLLAFGELDVHLLRT